MRLRTTLELQRRLLVSLVTFPYRAAQKQCAANDTAVCHTPNAKGLHWLERQFTALATNLTAKQGREDTLTQRWLQGQRGALMQEFKDQLPEVLAGQVPGNLRAAVTALAPTAKELAEFAVPDPMQE